MRTFPTLYKRSNTDAMLTWSIAVETNADGHGVIVTRHGQLNGAIQEGRDVVRKGKNLGKKNETTPVTQAIADAEGKWNKKVTREGYVEDLARAEQGETDQAGGIPPMLALDLKKCVKHVKFPCHIQRKYDGMRCIVIVEDGKVSLWSRQCKPVFGVPHIQAEYERLFANKPGRFVFDGELYRHGWSLQKIIGFCKKQNEVKPRYDELRHVVYDALHVDAPWRIRMEHLFYFTVEDFSVPELSSIVMNAPTFEVGSLDDAWRMHDEWVQDGYEGAILRNLDGMYEAGKRSPNLVKLKQFQEQEFTIVRVGEGRGKFEGKAMFTCDIGDGSGRTFECCAPGSLADRARYLQDAANIIGKPLTVKFFKWTDEGKPFLPTGKVIRDYE